MNLQKNILLKLFHLQMMYIKVLQSYIAGNVSIHHNVLHSQGGHLSSGSADSLHAVSTAAATRPMGNTRLKAGAVDIKRNDPNAERRERREQRNTCIGDPLEMRRRVPR